MSVIEIAAFLLNISMDIPFPPIAQEDGNKSQTVIEEPNKQSSTSIDDIEENKNSSSDSEPIFLLPKEAYLVGPGDTIVIDIWAGQSKEETLSNEYFVFSSGNIELPLLGKVMINDLSLESITKLLTNKLAEQYIRDPHVVIHIKEYGSQTIHVLGAVDKPGSFSLQGSMSLVEALASAQGTNPNEKGAKRAKIIRENGDILIVDLDDMFTDGTGNLQVRDGDVIFVMEGLFVVVNGKVEKPGTIPWREGMTITEAIVEAGGALPEANTRSIYIIRSNGEKFPANYKKILQGKLPDILLEHGDRVTIEESAW
jgi:polysaccharide biosynthesis/export protein